MFKVLLIVPYPELEGTVKRIYESDFSYHDFSLDVAVMGAEELRKDDWMNAYDVLIGRGHSARKLKQLLPEKPVVEISITGYDVMRAILAAKQRYQSKKMALFISDRTIHDERILSAASGVSVCTYIIPAVDDMLEAVEKAKADGVDTVIGGYSAVSAASRLGMHSVTIQTGEEAVYGVLQEARRLIRMLTIEMNRNKTYQTILQESDEGIIYVNEKRIIEIANKKAIQLMENQSESIHNQKLDAAFPYLTAQLDKLIEDQQYIVNELINVGGRMISFNLAPVVVGEQLIGVVITCQSASKIQQVETEIRKKLSEKGLIAKYQFKDIIHVSDMMEKTISKAKKFAVAESNVLIVGETGTGKELMAQSIHNNSARQKGPFVAVNCAALPENLLESELFGYAEGAFTGSKKGGKIGLFEQANNGTVFLDEISELPINFQGKLLRVLQERQVRRIGDDRVVNVNVRIIAATNRNLSAEVKAGKFRQDLLYRLDILRLYLPSLRERQEDIYPIFLSFLKDYNKKWGQDLVGCSKAARTVLEHYTFSGNIRELRNIAERISVMATENQVDEQLMEEALYPQDVGIQDAERSDRVGTEREKELTVAEIRGDSEREQILYALKKAEGKKSRAAQILGMDRTTLWRKMKVYHIQ